MIPVTIEERHLRALVEAAEISRAAGHLEADVNGLEEAVRAGREALDEPEDAA